jgi:hypothetical protein
MEVSIDLTMRQNRNPWVPFADSCPQNGGTKGLPGADKNQR